MQTLDSLLDDIQILAHDLEAQFRQIRQESILNKYWQNITKRDKYKNSATKFSKSEENLRLPNTMRFMVEKMSLNYYPPNYNFCGTKLMLQTSNQIALSISKNPRI